MKYLICLIFYIEIGARKNAGNRIHIIGRKKIKFQMLVAVGIKSIIFSK